MQDVFPSETEAKKLIKTPKMYTGFENHHFPPNGEEINIPLVSEFGNTDFILDIESKRLTLHGYKYQQRVYKNIILVRVDLGPKPHWNLGRVFVPGPHIHVYKEGYHDKIVNADFKIPKCAGLKIHKNQTSVEHPRGLANVEHGGIFNDSGHCPRRGTGKRLEKHQRNFQDKRI